MKNVTTLAKFSRPRLYAVVKRERLFRALDEARAHPIIFIAGPPGAGKSTLVASWLEARRAPGLWFQADIGDSDPATFFHYLSAAAATLGALTAAATGRVDIAAALGVRLGDLTLVGKGYSGEPGAGVWPSPATVLAGVVYGPTGGEYVGTLALLTAADVWAYARRDVNVVQVRGQDLLGAGTEDDPWGPV